ncbi:MAG TPA: amino acid permease [Steroidobacteraceae bacterium]|nr:amino acid permease [Steroidobacteraceae bacterium]
MAAELGPGRIRARLSTFDTAMVVFSLVVGIGIFRTPALVAGAAGGTALFFTAWIAGGLISLIGALTFAEIGSRYPRAGGYYRVVADCYNPTFAFMLNWAQTLMQGAGAAGVAFIGADYLMPVLLPPQWRTPHASLTLACATMLILLTLNYRGVKPGARVQNLLSVAKIAMIVGLALLALLLAPRAGASGASPSAAPTGLRLLSALIPCFYSYGGYQLTMNLGADLKDARRRFPLAITAGMVTVVGLYLLLNFAYQRVLSIGGIADSTLVAAALSRATFGPYGEVLISIAVFLSAAGFVNATIIQMPRSFYAMAQDGVLPRAFLRVNPDTQVQEVGLLFFGATMLLPAFVLGSFDKLLHYVMFTDTLTLAVVASTLFMLRRRHAGDGGFSMLGYPLLPIFYIVCLLGVALRVFSLEPRLAAAGIVILLTGWPLFRLGSRLFGGHGTVDS